MAKEKRKPTSPQADKPAKSKASKVAKTEKVTIYLTEDAALRLTVHAAKAKMDRSSYVNKLIDEHCRRFVVSDRGGSDTQPDPQTPEGTLPTGQDGTP